MSHARHTRRTAIGLLATLGLATAASAADATVMVRRSLDELAQRADLVVVADARAQVSLWSDGRIYTDVQFVVATGVRGGAHAGDALVVRTPGGTVGRTGQLVAGTPAFAAGQRYVLFLRHGRGQGAFETVGLAQGVLPVRGADAAEMVYPADTSGLELTGPASVTVPAEGIPLASLVRALGGSR